MSKIMRAIIAIVCFASVGMLSYVIKFGVPKDLIAFLSVLIFLAIAIIVIGLIMMVIGVGLLYALSLFTDEDVYKDE